MKLFASFAILVAAYASATNLPRGGFLKHEAEPPHIQYISLLEQHVEDADKTSVNLAIERGEESELPLSVQYLFAGTWIITLALMPLILPIMDKKPPTRTQQIVGASMMVVLFGGFYLFTNVIVFQSVHFKRVRPLTVVECIYFMAQVITTVGYGDVTPAKAFGQVFVGLYVLGALFIIAMVISDLTGHLAQLAEEYEEKQRAKDMSALEPDSPSSVRLYYLFKPAKVSMKPFMSAFAAFVALDVCWIVFFAMYPGEGKTWFQATYMSVITLSTVGFGWFTPVTEAGMIFGAFWMLFGSAALVNVIGEFTALMVKMHKNELLDKSESKLQAVDMLKSIVNPGSHYVTELDFLRFGLLQMNTVKEEELDQILKAFEALKPRGGKVPLNTVKECVSAEYNSESP